MAYNKYDSQNRNYFTSIDRWSGLTLVPGKGGSSSIKITSILPTVVENLKEIWTNSDSKTSKHLSESIKAATLDAADVLLPMKEEQFDKGYAKRTRNSRFAAARANSSWRVGYNTGGTKESLLKAIKMTNIGNLVKITDKQVRISYKIPDDVALRLFPRRLAKFDRKKLPIRSIKAWVDSDKNSSLRNSWEFRGKKKDSSEIAFAIANSWATTWKPSIMNESALSISRNTSAKTEFVNSLSGRLNNLPNSMKEDFNKSLKANG